MAVGLLDTSVVIDWDAPVVTARLPDEMAISVVTAAELTAGPHLTTDRAERARRQARLQAVESLFEPVVIDAAVVRAFGLIVAAVTGRGRHPRRRFADLLIAATAVAHDFDLYTRNGSDFAGLRSLVRVVVV